MCSYGGGGGGGDEYSREKLELDCLDRVSDGWMRGTERNTGVYSAIWMANMKNSVSMQMSTKTTSNNSSLIISCANLYGVKSFDIWKLNEASVF